MGKFKDTTKQFKYSTKTRMKPHLRRLVREIEKQKVLQKKRLGPLEKTHDDKVGFFPKLFVDMIIVNS